MQSGNQAKMNPILKALLAILVLLGAFGVVGMGFVMYQFGSRQPPRPDLQLTEKIKQLAPTAPISIVITRNKHRIYTEHWPAETDRHHAYALGRAGELFTAMAAAVLLDRGKLTLEDPVTRWLPLDAPFQSITIEHLLAHSSGLRGDTWPVNPTGEPGDTSESAGANYQLLTRILEAAAQEPLNRFIEKNIVKPLAMEHTHFHEQSHQWYACAEDLLAYELALNTNQIIRMKTYLRFFSPGKLTDGQRGQFGLGWRIADYRGLRLEQAAGAGQSYSHALSRFSQKNFSMIILSELPESEFDARQWTQTIADLYLDRELPKPHLKP